MHTHRTATDYHRQGAAFSSTQTQACTPHHHRQPSPFLLSGWHRQQVPGASTHRPLQAHQHVHTCGCPKHQHGPSAHPALLFTSQPLSPTPWVSYSLATPLWRMHTHTRFGAGTNTALIDPPCSPLPCTLSSHLAQSYQPPSNVLPPQVCVFISCKVLVCLQFL